MKTETEKSDVMSHSCIGCKYCIALSGKKFSITFCCILGQWNGKITTQKTDEQIKNLRCKEYTI